MKAAIYSPYLDSFGGGERYVMTIAECLMKLGDVDVFWDDQAIKDKLQERFHLDLSAVKFVPNVFQKNMIKKWQVIRNYDVLVYLSDGSFPFGFAKRNILHLQVPFTFENGKTIANKIKLRSWQHVAVNSHFTKAYIDRTFRVKSEVLYPPVDVKSFRGGPKEHVIVTVGRMKNEEHGKRHLLMIDAFKKVYNETKSDWQFVILGSIENRDYFDQINAAAKGYPISVLGNATFDQIVSAYQKAAIYWHAQGFEESEPQYLEHFGIATVEAMAAGCVPIVFGGGGQTEIVSDNENGLLWQTSHELIEKTKKLMADEKRCQTLAESAKNRSDAFSKDRFIQNFQNLLL